MPAKVMICYSDAGNGPLRASEALTEALHIVSGESTEVMMLDVLKETNRFGYLAVRIYNYLLTKNLTWNTLGLRIFYRSNLVKSGALLQFSVKSMVNLLAKEKPNVLVFTNPWVIAYVMRAVRELEGPKPKTVSMLIDLGCELLPPSWFDSDIDVYIAPTDEAREQLLGLGAVESRIRVLGMPISPKYLDDNIENETPMVVCGLCVGKPNILVMGGRAGTKNTFEIVKWLMESDGRLHLTVLCGHNKDLKRKIENHVSRLGRQRANKHIRVLGFEPDSYPFMRAADIVISKPGALTVSEVATLGIPVILDAYPSVMGQEVGNVSYVESRGLGLIAHSPAEVPKLVSTLINNKGISPALRPKGEKIAGTIEIARFIANMISPYKVAKGITSGGK